MDLESIMLSDLNQMEKDKISLRCEYKTESNR